MTEEDYEKALTAQDHEAIARYEKQGQRRGIPMVRAGGTTAGARKW
jgi:hypothetical protein